MSVQEVLKILQELFNDSNIYSSASISMVLLQIINVISLDEANYKQINELFKLMILIKTKKFDEKLYIETKTTLKKSQTI